MFPAIDPADVKGARGLRDPGFSETTFLTPSVAIIACRARRSTAAPQSGPREAGMGEPTLIGPDVDGRHVIRSCKDPADKFLIRVDDRLRAPSAAATGQA